MMDDWGMTAEDHEIEQDRYLRSLNEEAANKEHELFEAIKDLCARAQINRNLMILNILVGLFGAIITIMVIISYHGH